MKSGFEMLSAGIILIYELDNEFHVTVKRNECCFRIWLITFFTIVKVLTFVSLMIFAWISMYLIFVIEYKKWNSTVVMSRFPNRNLNPSSGFLTPFFCFAFADWIFLLSRLLKFPFWFEISKFKNSFDLANIFEFVWRKFFYRMREEIDFQCGYNFTCNVTKQNEKFCMHAVY